MLDYQSFIGNRIEINMRKYQCNFEMILIVIQKDLLIKLKYFETRDNVQSFIAHSF